MTPFWLNVYDGCTYMRIKSSFLDLPDKSVLVLNMDNGEAIVMDPNTGIIPLVLKSRMKLRALREPTPSKRVPRKKTKVLTAKGPRD